MVFISVAVAYLIYINVRILSADWKNKTFGAFALKIPINGSNFRRSVIQSDSRLVILCWMAQSSDKIGNCNKVVRQMFPWNLKQSKAKTIMLIANHVNTRCVYRHHQNFRQPVTHHSHQWIVGYFIILWIWCIVNIHVKVTMMSSDQKWHLVIHNIYIYIILPKAGKNTQFYHFHLIFFPTMITTRTHHLRFNNEKKVFREKYQ